LTAPVALAVEDIHAGYEPGLPIVRGASIAVAAGEIVAILGPNGAGKSTLIKAVAGLARVFAGRVLLDGQEITAARPHELARRGLAFVPQTENIFASMSVDNNVKIAAAMLPKSQRGERTDAVYDLFPDLSRQRSLGAGRLSGGQRQMLAVARALIVNPKVLMLDEPSAGLSPKLVGVLFAKIAAIREAGVTVLMVEQNARAALALADRAYILVEGRNRHEAPAAELLDDPAIGALYLGGDIAAGAAASR
jgi:branched-chain amino acid transport system ATP-binding protein